jgi:hypothetical protein
MGERAIVIGTKDITEHVARMYDAIVGSLDWGSQFLDTETIESILIVGKLAGWKLVEPLPDSEALRGVPWGDRKAAIEKWRAQVQAKIDAETQERTDG